MGDTRVDPTASSRAKKDDGLDPIARFATKGLDILDTHHSDIEVLKTKVDAIEQRDKECRDAQAASWRRFGERMEALETSLHGEVRSVADSVKQHIAADERSMKREESSKARSTTIWVAIIGGFFVLAGTVVSAITSLQAASSAARIQEAVSQLVTK